MSVKSISSLFFKEEDKNTCFKIYGYSSCPYYQKAINLGQIITNNHDNVKIETEQIDKEQWPDKMDNLTKQYGGKAVYHTTCPIVEEGCNEDAKKFVGGYSDFLNESRKRKLKR